MSEKARRTLLDFPCVLGLAHAKNIGRLPQDLHPTMLDITALKVELHLAALKGEVGALELVFEFQSFRKDVAPIRFSMIETGSITENIVNAARFAQSIRRRIGLPLKLRIRRSSNRIASWRFRRPTMR